MPSSPISDCIARGWSRCSHATDASAVVASAASVADAQRYLPEAGADVILLDLATPHALESVRDLASVAGSKVVALGVECLEAVGRGELS